LEERLKLKDFLPLILSLSISLSPGRSRAADDSGATLYTRPDSVGARSNAEYYSAAPETGLVMPINIWGSVREPGVHYVPIGSTLLHSVSVAGGPTDLADLDKVKLFRSGKIQYADTRN
jgi:hypothetical protein